MAFTPKTDHKESLQALAMSLRQSKGSDLDSSELADAMLFLLSISPKVKKHCIIDYSKMQRDFLIWEQSGAQDWIDSSIWIANAAYPQYCSSGIYNFYRQDFVPAFKETYNRIRNKIKANASSSILKKMYSIVGMSEDKWNPADIIAIKESSATNIMNLLENFSATKVSKESKEVVSQNKKINFSGNNGKLIHVMQDLDEMYEYNKLIHKLFDERECIGISLKKATSKSVKMVVMDHKDTGGIKKALNMKVDITNVLYSDSNQKCIVEFEVSGEKGQYLDIRGFESSRKISDVQVQLSKKGSSAAHGKITLPVISIITKLSRGRASFSAMNAKKRSMFKSLNKSSIHNFTDWSVFNDYVKNPVQLSVDKQNWADYIQWLSKNRHESVSVLNEVNKMMKSKRTGVFDASKYLKHKVQSYEVGYLLDTEQKQIREEIKENIIKSIISYAGSKGMIIFNDSKATAFMVSSTYLKCGG
jgi:hypothetical protein